MSRKPVTRDSQASQPITQKRKRHIGRKIFLLLASIGLVWLFAGVINPHSTLGPIIDPKAYTTDLTTPQPAPIKVTAAQVGKDYNGNKVAAEHKWAGKYVEFTGKVANIKDSGFTGPSISFDLPPAIFSQMVCAVTDEEQLNRPNLTEGGQATVRGTIEGDQTMGVVRMTDCTVL